MAPVAYAFFLGMSGIAGIFLLTVVIFWLDLSDWLKRLRFDRLVALANARTKLKKTATETNTPSS